MIPRFRSFLVLMAVMTLISGCGAVVEVQTGGSGTLSLSMTDASNDKFEAVYVTIDEIQIHLGGSESHNWETLPMQRRPITGDLFKLTNGVSSG